MQKTGAGEQKSCFSSPSPGAAGQWLWSNMLSASGLVYNGIWAMWPPSPVDFGVDFQNIPYVLLSFTPLAQVLSPLHHVNKYPPCHTSYVAALPREKKPEEPSRGLTLALQSWCVTQLDGFATVSFLSIVLLLFWMQSLSWYLPLP